MRLDKWLWVARFFKTRALAAGAIGAGKVQVNGARAKAAKALRVGDSVRVRQGPSVYHVTVRAFSARRGSASDAAQLYDEDPDAKRAREALVGQLKALPRWEAESGRPTKKERREIVRWKERREG